MACKNLSKYYPIVMKFSGYLILYEDTGAIRLAEHGPKVGHSELYCASVCTSNRILYSVTTTCCSITWCLLFPKWERYPKVGHSLKKKVVISQSLYTKKIKKTGVIKLLGVAKSDKNVLKWEFLRMSYVLSSAVVWSSFHPKKAAAESYKRKMPEANVPKVIHGPKMGQNEWIVLVFLWFSLVSCFIAHT